jgi:hypothetical protein
MESSLLIQIQDERGEVALSNRGLSLIYYSRIKQNCRAILKNLEENDELIPDEEKPLLQEQIRVIFPRFSGGAWGIIKGRAK